MPINSFLYPGAKFIPGYEVANSCRFNRGDQPNLSRTLGTPTNSKIWTFSFWYKRNPGTSQMVINSESSTSYMYFVSDTLSIEQYDGSYQYQLTTTRVFRDLSAWMHFCVAMDTTQGTDTNRLKLYVNGTQETVFSTATYPAEDLETNFNSAVAHVISLGGTNALDGYLAEVCLIDGTAYAASDFGEFDEDSPTIWKPKNVSGLTFGNNGFYFDFEDSSNLGNDANGGTDWTVANLAATDQSTDTPTLNYPTLNPLIGAISSLTISEGNLNMVATDANYRSLPSTMAATAGKWYAEFKAVSGFATEDASVGIYRADNTFVATTGLGNFTSGTTWSYGSGGLVRTSAATDDTEATYTDGDIIQVAMDLDNLKLYFGKNNTWINSGDPESGATGTGAYTIINAAPKEFYNFAAATISSKLWSCNFGSPSYANSSDAADENGYGAFEYAPPSGYYAMNSANLAEFGG